MRLEPADFRPTGYFIRSSLDGPERGPLNLDHLRDLAEFQHVPLTSLVRLRDDEEPRPLSEMPELLAAIFPEKNKLHFKSYRRTTDPDAGNTPVDVHDVNRCETGGVFAANPRPPEKPARKEA